MPSDTLYLYKYKFHIERRNEHPRIQIPNKDIVILYAHNTQWSTSTMSEREIVGDVSVFKKLFTSFSLDLSVRVLEEKLYEAKRIFLFKACTTYYIHTRYAINHIFLCLVNWLYKSVKNSMYQHCKFHFRSCFLFLNVLIFLCF